MTILELFRRKMSADIRDYAMKWRLATYNSDRELALSALRNAIVLRSIFNRTFPTHAKKLHSHLRSSP